MVGTRLCRVDALPRPALSLSSKEITFLRKVMTMLVITRLSINPKERFLCTVGQNYFSGPAVESTVPSII